MRIAMFTNNYKPYIGGVPISIEHLSESLRKLGHEVYVFAPTYPNQQDEPYVIRYPSFPIAVAGAPIPNVCTKLFEEKVKELQIDVIHVHHPALVGNIALRIKKKLGIPVVFTYHTRYEEYLYYIKGLKTVENHIGGMQRYLTWFCQNCDMLIAPTPEIKEHLLQKRITDTNVTILPTGIPNTGFQAEKQRVMEIRSNYLAKADFLFCTVSRLAKEKNLIFQLQGLQELKQMLAQKGKSFHYIMIGDGPQREVLQKEIAERGLSENISLLGNMPNEEIKNYYAASDAFLFSSKSETQGIVILEAMAQGTPVVAVNATGVRDVVKSGENGMLTSEHPLLWAKSIDKLMLDIDRYVYMSEEAKKTAMSFSEDKVARQAQECYGKVCAQVQRCDILFSWNRKVFVKQ